MKLRISRLSVYTLLTACMLSGSLFAESSASPTVALQPFVDKHELAGAVALVADKDKVLSIATVGFADVQGMKAMQLDAMFWIASQSKGMTSAFPARAHRLGGGFKNWALEHFGK